LIVVTIRVSHRILLPLLAGCVLCSAVLPRAVAVQLTYEIGDGSSVSGNLSDPGLVIKYALVTGLKDVAFSLNDGQSYTFDLFKIWTDETDVSLSEDTIKKPITMNLEFDTPDESLSLYGDTYGINGFWQWGQVTWDGPVTLALTDRTFKVSLSDEQFNKGFFGLDEGKKYGAIVQATVKQIGSSYVSVPDNGSTAMLVGLSLLVIASASKRRVIC
jgi:hypothetical protein